MSHRKNPIPTPVRGLPLPVGDAAVIAVAGEEGQLGTGRGLHPPDDEPHRCGVGLILEGDVGGLGHSGGAYWVSRFVCFWTSAGSHCR